MVQVYWLHSERNACNLGAQTLAVPGPRPRRKTLRLPHHPFSGARLTCDFLTTLFRRNGFAPGPRPPNLSGDLRRPRCKVRLPYHPFSAGYERGDDTAFFISPNDTLQLGGRGPGARCDFLTTLFQRGHDHATSSPPSFRDRFAPGPPSPV